MSTGTKDKNGAYGAYFILFVIQLPNRIARIPVTNIPSKAPAPPIEAVGLLIFYSVLAKKAFCGLRCRLMCLRGWFSCLDFETFF
jgi:hypothetical protein